MSHIKNITDYLKNKIDITECYLLLETKPPYRIEKKYNSKTVVR